MKIFISILLLCSILYGNAQVLKDRHICKLEELQIQTQNFDLNNERIQGDLNEILYLNKRRHFYIVFGAITGAISATTTTTGIVLINIRAQDHVDPTPYFGGVSLILGALTSIATVISFKRASKRKNERDNLVSLYNGNSIWVRYLPTGEVHFGRKGKITACGIKTKK